MANDQVLEEKQKQDKALMEDADYFTRPETGKKWRVRMSIYNTEEGEEDGIWTDEPLFTGASQETEIVAQAYRTLRHHNKNV